ncbi:MAG: heat shock protein Hsp20 [Phycisphaerales bacterium]|nr:heat shock protein Hsp20 [Phycisphaerales bacterium]
MTVKLASESPHGHPGRPFGGGYSKNFFGFAPADTWTPNVNLYESDVCYLVCVDLAGVHKQDIEVTVQQQRLRLTGKRIAPAKAADDPCNVRPRVHLMEIDHGAFSREVELPADVDQERIAASFDNGLLWIELPKV